MSLLQMGRQEEHIPRMVQKRGQRAQRHRDSGEGAWRLGVEDQGGKWAGARSRGASHAGQGGLGRKTESLQLVGEMVRPTAVC